ncbi:hypothetical protein DFH09DRAFT_1330720 [Mycena vulgaris]|nr:hypothetical protein DFH09DRAFT_1330720 [Mycena vulgaris]
MTSTPHKKVEAAIRDEEEDEEENEEDEDEEEGEDGGKEAGEDDVVIRYQSPSSNPDDDGDKGEGNNESEDGKDEEEEEKEEEKNEDDEDTERPDPDAAPMLGPGLEHDEILTTFLDEMKELSFDPNARKSPPADPVPPVDPNAHKAPPTDPNMHKTPLPDPNVPLVDPNTCKTPPPNPNAHKTPAPPSDNRELNPPETVPHVAGFEADPGSLDDQMQADRPPTPPRAPTPPQTPPVSETRTSLIEDINISLRFITALQAATLDSSEERLDPELLDQIRNPATEILTVKDPDDRLSIDIFLAIGNASEASYTSVRAAILRRNPEYKILSYYKVKRLVSDLTGVVSLEQDMCINSCIG